MHYATCVITKYKSMPEQYFTFLLSKATEFPTFIAE